MDGRPGRRSVDHTRPLPSSVNIAGLHVVAAGVTPHAESRSSLKETHPIGGGGGGRGWRRLLEKEREGQRSCVCGRGREGGGG